MAHAAYGFSNEVTCTWHYWRGVLVQFGTGDYGSVTVFLSIILNWVNKVLQCLCGNSVRVRHYHATDNIIR